MALEGDPNVVEIAVQLLAQHDGLSHMAEVVRILLNEAVKVERAQTLVKRRCCFASLLSAQQRLTLRLVTGGVSPDSDQK